MLSAKATVDDRVKGLQAGGDDYVPKPFAFAGLLARVRALVRRGSRATQPTTLQAADLTLDLLSRKVTRAGTKIELQAREFALLEYLMRVCRLRNKVDKDFEPKLIRTVRGMGYVLEVV